ncbi:phage integrase [Azorhizobium caulinodans ORS 571]|uniref:Phage integrase n=1 Tax=Azorhizobium caulinodans (strain ATCC 43989 / DSM 5975 / JCM 20966 / LMG 6465 / NBRC 14845 / NCIMB 13405 / ORS 571) TaxID=438753 RepID=A8HXQ4_AZOC5|nr:tyrosine-type recombinase/integrase [Azorhizobium caulinodans]BAF87525.1 phage integrase [Azorhizobium caulinodans ORS 571]
MGYQIGLPVGYREESKAAPMGLDRRYLKKHGNQWIVVIKVPDRLRHIVGKAHLKVPLHTDSLAIANREKFRIVADMKARLQRAEEQRKSRAGLVSDPLIEEALQWRESIAVAEADPGPFIYDDDDVTEDARDVTLSLLRDRAEEIARKEGLKKADDFHAIAKGKATPILPMIDKWLAERPMKPRQQTDYRRAALKFTSWLTVKNETAAVERITRKLAGRYITESFVETGVNPRTANKDISCLSSFWKWLERKGHVEDNVWARQSLAKREPPKAEAKRPYTDDEMRALFGGAPSVLLRDMMAIAALSGMRVEEIARLTVADIFNGCFDITEAKTKAGVRMVPIHPALDGIVSRRTKDKAPSAPLFPELPIPKPGSPIERSQKVVKAFTAYRRKIGVDDVPKAARQSRVDFHSFRRWFVTKAEQAHQPVHFIEALVGHKRSGMTLGRYSEGPLVQQMRAVVEAVQLPTGCLVE